MANVKSGDVAHYELLYVIANKFSENELAPINTKIQDFIKEQAKDITLQEDWGKRRLAYPIKLNYFGYYFLVEFNSAKEKVGEIDKMIKLMPEIIRHQIISRPKITEKTARSPRLIREQVEPTKEKQIEAASESPEKKPKETKKLDLKELDEKLDKILDVDSLL
jgi:small subunit ribosomal protein S6